MLLPAQELEGDSILFLAFSGNPTLAGTGQFYFHIIPPISFDCRLSREHSSRKPNCKRNSYPQQKWGVVVEEIHWRETGRSRCLGPAWTPGGEMSDSALIWDDSQVQPGFSAPDGLCVAVGWFGDPPAPSDDMSGFLVLCGWEGHMSQCTVIQIFWRQKIMGPKEILLQLTDPLCLVFFAARCRSAAIRFVQY